jgi:hypothetical protein
MLFTAKYHCFTETNIVLSILFLEDKYEPLKQVKKI